MAENKKQHFVSKLLLSKFSVEKFTNSYDLKNEAFKHIPYGNQCQKHYLYGNDKILEDKVFEKIETKVAPIIDNYILSKNILPDIKTIEYDILLNFISMQLSRTPYYLKYLENTYNIISNIHNKSTIEEKVSQRAQLTSNVDYFDLMKIGACHLPLLFNLSLVLVKNETPIEFIFSDNPCFIFNRFTRNKNGTTGLSNSGIEILLPISPKRALLLSDPSVYEVKSQINIDEFCVDEINKTICSYTDQLIYFRYLNKSKVIEYLNCISKNNVYKAPIVENTKIGNITNIEISKTAPSISNELKLLKIKSNLNKIPIKHIDPVTDEIHKLYCKKVMEGSLKVSDWKIFFTKELQKRK